MKRKSRNDSVLIPMVDLGPLHESLREPIAQAIFEVVRRGDFVQGENLDCFEENVARYLGVGHAIGVASGTDALILALRASGVTAGDEVITTPYSFWATTEAIHHVGAQPVYVDISPHDLNLDPAQIEAAITPRTRAVLPVHIFGHAADMTRLTETANRHGLAVIEDAAQAFGAEWRSRKVGTFGLAGCFSFYPSKPLGCFGDGGLIVTDDDGLADELRRLRNHGVIGRDDHHGFAYNSRLDSLQAAVLDVKLQHLDAHLTERRRLAKGYMAALTDLPVELPHLPSESTPVFGQFTLRAAQREPLRRQLAAAGIVTAVYYASPLYRQPAVAHQFRELYLPVTESVCMTCLSLPLYQGLGRRDQATICDRIRSFFDKPGHEVHVV